MYSYSPLALQSTCVCGGACVHHALYNRIHRALPLGPRAPQKSAPCTAHSTTRALLNATVPGCSISNNWQAAAPDAVCGGWTGIPFKVFRVLLRHAMARHSITKTKHMLCCRETHLLNLCDSHLQRGVDPVDELFSTNKICTIHHSNCLCHAVSRQVARVLIKRIHTMMEHDCVGHAVVITSVQGCMLPLYLLTVRYHIFFIFSFGCLCTRPT